MPASQNSSKGGRPTPALPIWRAPPRRGELAIRRADLAAAGVDLACAHALGDRLEDGVVVARVTLLRKARCGAEASPVRHPGRDLVSGRNAARSEEWLCAGAALVLPYADTFAMQQHLNEIAKQVAPVSHAVVLLDNAGWHKAKKLKWPGNLSPLFVPPPRAQCDREHLAISAPDLPLEPRLYRI
jgi:hypothetical protein